MANFKGLVTGILSSSTFGLIPLFTLPLMAQGMTFDSILFYRFLTAGVAIGLLLPIRGESFVIRKSELPTLCYLSLFYVMSALFLFWGYNYLPSGVATTIHFMYPVFVTLIMSIIYHERLSAIIITSISDTEQGIDLTGIVIVLISAISYALYIVRVNKSKVRNMNGTKLTFYVLMIGSLIFLLNAQLKGGVQSIPDGKAFMNILMLAILPTVVSNLALVYAIKNIGSTLTAILGAMEPLTALSIGILVFAEPLTPTIALGFILIISAVSLIILAQPIQKGLRQLVIQLKRH